MKKDTVPFFALGVAAALAAAFFAVPALATYANEERLVQYNNVDITLNGKAVTLVDEKGAATEPFIIEGTTYVPVRAIASALGLEVGWNNDTTTVLLTTKAKQAPSPAASQPPREPPQEAPALAVAGDLGGSYKTTYTSAISYTSGGESVWGQTIVAFENTGAVNLKLEKSAYTLKDASGAQAASRSGISLYPPVIKPGEKGYLYDETALYGQAGGRTFSVEPALKAAPAESCLRLDLRAIALSDTDYGGVRATGIVDNNTGAVRSNVGVCVILFDGADKPAGVLSATVCDSLAAGASAYFEAESFMLPESVTAAGTARYQAYAYAAK